MSTSFNPGARFRRMNRNEAGQAPKEPEAPRRRRPGYSLNLPPVKEKS
jgi:hypothetical protein